ncbi:hypothetical protein [Niallia taxi]|uniref:hypothetical protein n=1 Tax=Niallia taxi TaxID=2499688 RepID=UPI002E1F77CA|nr:hypothetical protein [Niallia taxi]
MSKSEEEYLLEQNQKDPNPYFDAPDKKILTTDIFRGPNTGMFSDFDLNNPGQKLMTDRDKLEEDIKKGKF